MSAASSINFDVGLPRPCPALVSTLSRIGFSDSPPAACCSWATNLCECIGTTRSSVSAVRTRIGGYSTPGLTL